MCNRKKIFIFCTCVEKERTLNKNNFLQDYSWNLTRYLGKNESSLMGKIVIPKKDLGNDLTVDNILTQLNDNIKSFDFDYHPHERDCLDINIPDPKERIRYFRVKFLNGKWTEGGNNIFTSITKKIAEGKIEKRNTTTGINDCQ